MGAAVSLRRSRLRHFRLSDALEMSHPRHAGDRRRAGARCTSAARSELGEGPSERVIGVAARLAVIVGLAAALSAPADARFVTFESGPGAPARAVARRHSPLRRQHARQPPRDLRRRPARASRTSASVPVGLEPVAVAARTDGEVWVVNHLSDSVSIVDVAPTPPRVVAHAAGRRRAARHRLRRPQRGGSPRLHHDGAPRPEPARRRCRRCSRTPGVGARRRLGVRRDRASAPRSAGPARRSSSSSATRRARSRRRPTARPSTPRSSTPATGRRAISEGAVCNGGAARGRAASTASCAPAASRRPACRAACRAPNDELPGHRAARRIGPHRPPRLGLRTVARGRASAATGRTPSASICPDRDVFAIDAHRRPPVRDGRLRPQRRHGPLQHGRRSRERRSSTSATPRRDNEVRFEGPGTCAGRPCAAISTRRASR